MIKSKKKKASKLFELLEHLGGKELKDLQNYVKMSTNHLSTREEEIILQLLQIAKSQKVISEKKVISEILRDKDLANWNRLKNRMLVVLENYIALVCLRKKEPIFDFVILEYYSKNDLSKNYRSKLKKIQKSVDMNYQRVEWSDFVKYKFLEIQVEKNSSGRTRDLNLIELDNSLEELYIEHKLKILCERLNRQSILNYEAENDKIKRFIKNIQVENLDTIAKCYYYVCKLIQSSDSLYLSLILDELKEINPKPYKNFFDTILSYCLNHIARRINKGYIEDSIEYVNLIDLQIEYELFENRRRINPGKFKNCITIALLANNPLWASNFLNRFIHCLPKGKIQEVEKLCKAQILFFQEKFDQCHDELIGYHTDDFYFRIAYDKIILKLMYLKMKRREFKLDNLKPMIDRLKRYVSKHQNLSQHKKETNLKFLKLLWDLILNKPIPMSDLKGKIPAVDYVWIKKEAANFDNLS